MSDTLLHCFACDAFSPQVGDALACSDCQSEFVEIVQVERSPPGIHDNNINTGRTFSGNTPNQYEDAPGLPSMLTNLLSSILPTVLPAGTAGARSDHGTDEEDIGNEQPSHGRAAYQEQTQQSTPQPFNEFFSQMFTGYGQTTGRDTSGQDQDPTVSVMNDYFTQMLGRQAHARGGRTDDLNDDDEVGTGGQTRQTYASTTEGRRPQMHYVDLSTFLAHAFGGNSDGRFEFTTLGDFDNIISDFQNRNPQAATERAMSQIHRVQLRKDAQGMEGEKIGDECSICQDEYKDGETLAELQCQHLYHDECLLSWLKTNGICPICRRPVREREMVPEQDALD